MKPTLAQALQGLYDPFGPPVREIASRFLTPDFWQSTDGRSVSRAEVLLRAAELRRGLIRARVIVHAELRDALRFASHHTVIGIHFDGSETAHESYSFAICAADGRFRSVSESTRRISLH